MSSEKLVFDYSTPKILRLKLSGDWQITAGPLAADEVIATMAMRADLEQIAPLLNSFNNCCL